MSKRVLAIAFMSLVLLQGMLSGCGISNDTEQLMVKAKEYRDRTDYKSAVIELKNVLQKNADHAEARYLLGVTYNDTGDFVLAEQELRRALERGYDRGKTILALGRALLATGQSQKILDEIKPDSHSAEVSYLRGMASLALGRRDDARTLFEQALVNQPEFADAVIGQAHLAAMEGKHDIAAGLIDRVLAIAPRNVDAWLMKGDYARVAGNSAAALEAYHKALGLNPHNAVAQQNITSLYIAAGKYEEARKQIEEMRKLASARLMGIYLQGVLELRQKNYRAARDAVQKVLAVAPNHVPSQVLAGAAEAALGSHAQAQAHLTRALERAPNNLYARTLLVSSLASSGQAQRAVEVLQPALKQAPDDVALMSLAGEVYMQANDPVKAEEYFERAANRAPKSSIVRTRLGVSRLTAGDTEQALTDLESAVQLDPSNYRADIQLVLAHLRQRDYDKALEAARTLEKKQPQNPLAHNLLATVYLSKKDVPSARKHFERALELQPTYVPAAMNLAQLDLREKNPQSARRRLESVLEKDRNNMHALLALASVGPAIGASTKEQLDWLTRASNANPRSPQPHLMMARLHARSGDAKNALAAAQQAHALAPENPQVLEALGASQMNVGQKEQALTTYTQLVATQPKSPGALLLLARAQAANANPNGASSSLRKALSLKPDFIEAKVGLVNLEIRQRNYPEAVKLARDLQKQAPKRSIGFALEGDVLSAERKHLQAAKAYETAYSLGKTNLLAIKLHEAYSKGGKPEEGESRLAQWLKERPDDGLARLYAADVNLKRGKYKEAIQQYEWLENKKPGSMVVLNNLAWAYYKTRDPRALETAERAYKRNPSSPLVADTLGWILVEQGDMKRGLELLQKAVGAAPKQPEMRFHLAQAWLKAGDKAKARSELELLLSGDVNFPEKGEAQKLLKQLSQ